MKDKPVPDTIQAIVAQAGGMGLRGAFAYVGARDIKHKCAEAVGEYRSSRPSHLGSKRGLGCVRFEVGLRCRVNGRRGRNWTLVIAYEPNDTYTVWLVEGHAGRQPGTMVLACQRDVYCDTLKAVIEATYDQAIRDHNHGFISLS